MADAWTDERVELLRQLHKEGLSASQMATEICRKHPGPYISRNAAIGKANRLGLGPIGGGRLERGSSVLGLPKTRISNSPAALRPKPKLPPRPAPALFAKPNADGFTPHVSTEATPPQRPDLTRLEVLPDTACTLEDLEPGMCRWPIGDPQSDAFRFCGCQRSDGATAEARFYCEEHLRLSKGDKQPKKPKTRSHGAELARQLRRYVA